MKKLQFLATPEHIKLIKRMWFYYEADCEFGAPAIDPKRPYGNSDVYSDIEEILDIAPLKGDEFTMDQMASMDKLHRETTIALQIGV